MKFHQIILYIITRKWGIAKIRLHHYHIAAIKSLSEYIESVGDINSAKTQIQQAGWPEEYTHEAIVYTLKADSTARKFISIAKRRHLERKIARNKFIASGWDPILVDEIMGRYW